MVVAGAGGEVALGRALGHGLLEGDRALAERHAGAVVDDDDQAEVGQLGQQGGHVRGELGLVDQGHEVGVGEEVAELLLRRSGS